MKILAIFMTVIMLISGFDLCEEGSSLDGAEKAELAGVEHERNGDLYACSPFCHCSQCSFSILLPKVLSQQNPFNIAIYQYEKAVPGIQSPVSPSVWQPPKFA